MEEIKRLEDLYQHVQDESSRTLAVAAAQDPDTIQAVARAVRENVVKAVLVGDQKAIANVTQGNDIDPDLFEIVHVQDNSEAAAEAVNIVRRGDADMLMKGLVQTDVFIKAVLNKKKGLLPPGALLSHVAVIQVPTYPRLLIISDAAIVPIPNLEQKIEILKYTIEIANALGKTNPKAAIISSSESVSMRVQSSVDSALITTMAGRRQIEGAIVDGPLAVDLALSPERCIIKGVDSTVCGAADILVFPNIESANTFYKTVSVLSNGKMASLVVGTSAPIILTSRADSDDTKFFSICLAARLASQRFYTDPE